MGQIVRTSRRVVPAIAGVLLATGLLSLTAAAVADAASVTWVGGSSSTYWSDALNWQGGTLPGSLNTLSFPDLDGPCDNQFDGLTPSTDACYSVVDNAGTLNVGEIELDSFWPWSISGHAATDRIEITAQSGSGDTGLEASPSIDPGNQPSSSLLGKPDISVPIVLGNSQGWDVDGGNIPAVQQQGLEIDDVSGSNAQLGIRLSATLYTTSIATGALTLSGNSPYPSGAIEVEPNPNNPSDQPELPPAGVELFNGAGLTIAAPGTQSGSIWSSDSLFGGGSQLVSVGTGSAPDGSLAVNGDFTLANSDELDIYVDGPATTPPTPTPSLDYSQLTASGSVTLGDAALDVDLGEDSGGNCDDLLPGQVYTLISAGTVTGELDIGGTPISDGQTVSLNGDCSRGSVLTPPTVRINYNTSSSPETVTATVISGGNAGDFPALAGASPGISSAVPVIGSPLRATTGGWNGGPSTYDYVWYSCPASTGPGCNNQVGGDTASYTPTSSDLGNTIEVCVYATNQYGVSMLEYCSNPTAPVALAPPPTTPASASQAHTPTTRQIKSDLNKLSHPSGKKAITALLKGGSFKTSFGAPSGGSLSVVWTTIVPTGTGKHRKHKTVTVATGTASPPPGRLDQADHPSDRQREESAEEVERGFRDSDRKVQAQRRPLDVGHEEVQPLSVRGSGRRPRPLTQMGVLRQQPGGQVPPRA